MDRALLDVAYDEITVAGSYLRPGDWYLGRRVTAVEPSYYDMLNVWLGGELHQVKRGGRYLIARPRREEVTPGNNPAKEASG